MKKQIQTLASLGALGVLYVPHTEKEPFLADTVLERASGEPEDLGRCAGGGVEGEKDYAAAARLRLGLEDRR